MEGQSSTGDNGETMTTMERHLRVREFTLHS